MTNDYKGKDYTASITAVNNDVIQNSGIFLDIYTHTLTLFDGKTVLSHFSPDYINKRMLKTARLVLQIGAQFLAFKI